MFWQLILLTDVWFAFYNVVDTTILRSFYAKHTGLDLIPTKVRVTCISVSYLLRLDFLIAEGVVVYFLVYFLCLFVYLFLCLLWSDEITRFTVIHPACEANAIVFLWLDMFCFLQMLRWRFCCCCYCCCCLLLFVVVVFCCCFFFTVCWVCTLILPRQVYVLRGQFTVVDCQKWWQFKYVSDYLRCCFTFFWCYVDGYFCLLDSCVCGLVLPLRFSYIISFPASPENGHQRNYFSVYLTYCFIFWMLYLRFSFSIHVLECVRLFYFAEFYLVYQGQMANGDEWIFVFLFIWYVLFSSGVLLIILPNASFPHLET